MQLGPAHRIFDTGDGGIDLAGIFAILPRDLPISVEIPHDKQVAAIGPAEWARRALAATKRVLEKLGPRSLD